MQLKWTHSPLELAFLSLTSLSIQTTEFNITNMERRRPSCSDSLPRSEAQIRLFPEKFDESSTDDRQKLPPVDGGFQAWMFLMACVMLEALIWVKSACTTLGDDSRLTWAGFAFAFGVFQKYYHAHEAFQDSNMVAVVGTCATVRSPTAYDGLC